MKYIFPLFGLICFASVAAAQDHGMNHMSHMDHSSHMQMADPMPKMDHNMDHAADIKPERAPDMHVMPADYHEIETTPTIGAPIKKYARDDDAGVHKNFGEVARHDNDIFWTVMADRFEYRLSDGDDIGLWDTTSWIGGDYNKFYVKSEGEYNLDEHDLEGADVELLYSRNVSSFWDFQIGYRHDFIDGLDDRDFAAVGFMGLAPYWIETDATAYISDEGDLSATVEGEFDLLLTQKLILQPRAEVDLALQDVPEYNVGSGLNKFETGLRLRYEFSRKFAPYVGVSYEQAVGETHNLMQADGEDTSNTAVVTGLKFWF